MANDKIEARITLYNISQAGLYERGEKDPIFGDLSIFLKDLKAWVSGKTLNKTCTYACLDEDELKTFCYDIQEGIQGHYLLITWNKVSSFSNSVAAVSGTSKVGEADIKTTSHGLDDIPGFPTYFWIMPDQNKFAAITFDYSQNGRQDLNRYLREFFGKLSGYVVKKTDEEGKKVIQHFKDPKGTETYPMLYGKFDAKLVVNPGKVQYLLNNWKDIRKVYRHNEMSISEMIKLPRVATLGKWIGMNCESKKTSAIKFKLEADMIFNNKEELQSVIDEWDQIQNPTKWENLGFGMLGNTQKPIWLSASRAIDTFNCPLERDSKQLFKSKELVQWLDSITPKILKLEEKNENN